LFAKNLSTIPAARTARPTNCAQNTQNHDEIKYNSNQQIKPICYLGHSLGIVGNNKLKDTNEKHKEQTIDTNMLKARKKKARINE
jgi:hypothetical protein